MALVAIPRGLHWPIGIDKLTASATTVVIDAAGEQCAMIGRLHIDGRPTSAKTLSTGTIQWRTGAVTFANGGTTVDIGMQGVATGAGPIAQPDTTFTVKTTLTGGGGGITANAWQTSTMSSGSASLTHGDLVAVVWNMTARAGADSVAISPCLVGAAVTAGFPITNANASGSWQTTVTVGAGRTPNVMIVFDDGTLGWIDEGFAITSSTTDAFAEASNPDERGMIFQLPFDCKIDALWCWGGTTDANSDFTFKFWSDSTGAWTTPTSVTSVGVLAENLSQAGNDTFIIAQLATEQSLSKNTDYAVTMRATGTSNSRLVNFTLGATAHRAMLNGGTTLKKLSRQNDAGAFTIENPAVTMYQIGVRISQVNDTAGYPASRVFTGQ